MVEISVLVYFTMSGVEHFTFEHLWHVQCYSHIPLYCLHSTVISVEKRGALFLLIYLLRSDFINTTLGI